ncbi:MAG: Asp-tRNA(Asn)/Glu-tRNA(Gln) amidotransferase subunit GatA [Patescibacteria group bacterium]
MELHKLTIDQAHLGLTKKEFSSRELTEACLALIKKTDGKIQAFIAMTKESALRQANEADKKISSGKMTALTGIPLAIKDNILVSGAACTSGSRILEKYIAAYDATVIAKLKSAGAVFLGKTNMDEFAMGSSTENSAYFNTHNPWDIDRVPGGSSGGSAAAVSADMCLAALGSDTGSSIRQPAAFCGVVGLKPTYGRVSRFGLSAMGSSLDQIGPLTKTVKDCAALFSSIAGPDGRDATAVKKPLDFSSLKSGVKGLKIGVAEEYFVDGMDQDIRTAVKDAIKQLESLGAKAVKLRLPHTKYALSVYLITVMSEVSSNLARFDGIRYGLSADDAAKNLFEVYSLSKEKGFGDEAKRRIILGTFALSAGYYDQYYVKAQKVRSVIKRELADAFKKVDCLITPTTPSVAFKLGEKFADPLLMYLSDIYNVQANIGGLCGISIPCGFTKGLPIGLQIMGKSFDEATVLRTAYAYEQSTEWHTRQPKLG